MRGMGAVAVLWSVLATVTTGLQAGTIDDASFFSSLPTTQINFETYADGSDIYSERNPGMLLKDDDGGWATMYYDEYEDDYGVWFEYYPNPGAPLTDLTYGNDAGEDSEAAQAIGGSLEISIPSPSADAFAMIFEVPVRAFGFWVVNDNTVGVDVIFTAKNASGVVLDTVAMTADGLVDGTIGVADYGFMGIWATEDIARVEITKDAAILDNLMFSEVPEPATAGVLVLGALAGLLRRKR